MLRFTKMTLKNFMSYGNIEHVMELNDNILSLIMGENKDASTNGGSTDSNGVGKSTVPIALSYALYDRAIGNIKKDNLVNKLNEKNMSVSIEFSKNNNEYKIIRGRKPNFLKFYINDQEYDENVAQGENRETQHQIEKIVGMGHDLFKQIIVLSAQNEPFLSLRVKEQRDIIEELLGITILSEKAENLKNQLKEINKRIEQETFEIQTLQNLNDKTLTQIQRMETISSKWERDHKDTLNELEESISGLEVLDIEKELKLHEINKEVTILSDEYQVLLKNKRSIEKTIKSDRDNLSSVETKLNKATVEKKCYACGQEIDSNHDEMIRELNDTLVKFTNDLYKHEKTMEDIVEEIEKLEVKIVEFGDTEQPFYSSEKDAWNHNSTIQSLQVAYDKEIKQINPYLEQIVSIKNENLATIDIKNLDKMKDDKIHMEFLFKILTNKDSFVRKKIIDQSLVFLNYRLDYYLTELGLPHTVKFQNDLSVSIDLLGREYDFDNLSRGQKTRLILSLNLSFVDVYETLNNPINVMFIDELMDNGLDGSGVESAIKIFKEISRNVKKSVFLISHREEIQPRVENIIKIVMENGFSSIEKD